MRLVHALMAFSIILVSAANAKSYDDLPLASTICAPTLSLLAEPTTSKNLTFSNGFDENEIMPTIGNLPEDPISAGTIAILIIEAIGEHIGNRIFEELFPNGAKTRLTKKDLEAIKKIVREALREKTVEELDECVYSIQQNNLKMIGDGFQREIAIDLQTTTDAVFNRIVRFDHRESQLAMMPSAMLIQSLNVGLMQEMVKRKIVTVTFFNKSKGLVHKETEKYLKNITEAMDHSDWETMPEHIYRYDVRTERPCWNEEKDSDVGCVTVKSWHWRHLAFNARYKPCSLSGKGKSCEETAKYWLGLSSKQFINELIEVREAIYVQDKTDGKKDIEYWMSEVKAAPATENYTPYVRISPPRAYK